MGFPELLLARLFIFSLITYLLQQPCLNSWFDSSKLMHRDVLTRATGYTVSFDAFTITITITITFTITI